MVAHVAIKRHTCHIFKLSAAKKSAPKRMTVSSTASELGQHLRINMPLSRRISWRIHARISAMDFPTLRIPIKKGTELVPGP
jgi:hypothetical protein